jgi:UDP-N-acetyl-D-galactosamine dehydrogenase
MKKDTTNDKLVIGLVGLGYVGLPLVTAFAEEKVPVIGFDISERKVEQLRNGFDENNELTKEELTLPGITYTTDPEELKKANFIIVAVPTPVDDSKKPDLTPVVKASETVGKIIQKGTYVVYESTVYPGVTEEICLPVIEEHSGLKAGTDWKIGYSPERINPGDHEHSLKKVIKVVSGMDEESLKHIAKVYGMVCKAGVYEAASIKVAEAEKIIENTQRDVNIALMNELAIIFDRLGINTKEVIEAAATKWNFHKYTPGLVGGHCIGVDPYYLVYRAEQHSLYPNLISASRRVNDNMAEYVANGVIRKLIEMGKVVDGALVLIAGLAFKENVNDFRNSKSGDIAKHLRNFGVRVEAYDPFMEEHFKEEFDVDIIESPEGPYDAVIFPIYHQAFKKKLDAAKLGEICSEKALIYDVKSSIVRDDEFNKRFVYKSL